MVPGCITINVRFVTWRYLGENAIEISDISSNINAQLGLRDYLKRFPELRIASFIVTDKNLTLVSDKHGFMSISKIIDKVSIYQHDINVNASLPLSIIPICYDEVFALDYRTLERLCKLDFEEIITLHLNAEYTVAMFGFMPGFPYFNGLPLSLAIPRLKSPRKIIPKGSVAIANEMCGIYPNQSPGGWHIIGRTPLTLFDPLKENLTPLKLGQRVKFQQISIRDFHEFTPN